MPDIPEAELEETRAALAPTLEAIAAILPRLAKPRLLRFDPELNQRWVAAARSLGGAWSDRHGIGSDDIRPAIFSLYSIALEAADADCLHLGEALASASDLLEEAAPPPRLIAALTAAIECLNEPDGLEHEAFVVRAQHFAQRLETTITLCATAGERSPVLDRLFVEDTRERIELMHDALAALPPDVYALKTEAAHIAEQAELLERFGIMHLARQLAASINAASDLDSDFARDRIEQLLQQIVEAIAAVNA